MRLDISEILRDVGKRVEYAINEPPLVDEFVECLKPIQGKIVFTNTGGTLLVTGKADTTVALPCSRCGDHYFEKPADLTFDEQFELRHEAVGPRTLQTVTLIEEDENPIAGRLVEGQVFFLTEMLRQYLVLDEPTKPLPPDTADGKCGQCLRRPADVLAALNAATPAENENQTESEPPINPAFAKLSELLEKEE